MGYYNWANRQLVDLMGKDPTYTRSKYPGMRLGLANQLFNGRMFGAADQEKNIFSNQASYNDAIQRNSTDAASAAVQLANSYGMTDQAITNLGTQEKQNKYGLLSNLNDAYQGMQNEDQLQEQDKIRRYGDLVQLKGAQAANKLGKRKALWNTVSSIGNLAVGLVSGGIIKNPFGGGQKKPNNGGSDYSGY